MDVQSQQKVIDRGFTIIRCDDQPSPRIKFKDLLNNEWTTDSRYPTKAERDRAFKLMLTDPFVIQD